MKRYFYDGPVKEFERCIMDRWQASTCAVSKEKAISNLIFRFKMEHGKTAYAKISLPGKIITFDERNDSK